MTRPEERDGRRGAARRRTLAALVSLAAAPAAFVAVPVAFAARPRLAGIATAWAAEERAVGARLGVALFDGRGRRLAGHRADERFPMCSTFKLVLAGLVLAGVDRGDERLDRVVAYTRDELVTYSPVTEPAAARGGMRIDELCAAAVTLSDNTAANVLLREFGGPAALTRFARTLGDRETRLDRIEPALNDVGPGDVRDTTTPTAMAGTIHALLFGRALSSGSRAVLERWLRDGRTGDARLRAGLAPGWQAGEKTGTGLRGTTNDVGVLWAPGGAPWIVAAFLTGGDATAEARNAALANVARAVVAGVG